MRVLGIETSCDETGVAVYDESRGLLSDELYSQVALHAPYGGVVPELASRDHIQKLIPLVEQALANASTKSNDLDAIAYTAGPGLIGALLVGGCVAKSLGYAWGVPTLAIHHMEGHLLAPLMSAPAPAYPFLALLVSGGHTLLVAVQRLGDYHVLAESLDDAVGEAFDKTAKIMGLGYPGGPALEQLAQQGHVRFNFPRPMTNRPGLDFSFSGLKTAVLNTYMQLGEQPSQQDRADIACSFQHAVAETLTIKCRRALKQTGFTRLVVAGGVSANQSIATALRNMTAQQAASVYFPQRQFCTDNGAMIAFAGLQHMLLDQPMTDTLAVQVRARWPLGHKDVAKEC